MLLLFALNIRKNKYYIYNDKEKNVVVLKKDDILRLCQNKSICNIRNYGDEIKGKNYSLYRFNDFCENGRYYIITVIKNKGTIIGYEYISSNGKVYTKGVNEARAQFSRQGIVNGKVTNGEIELFSDTYQVVDKASTFKEISYGIEEYSDLYKKYIQIGLSIDKKGCAQYKPVFGVGVLDRVDVESSFHSFIGGHKIMCSILNKAHIIKIVPVYSQIIYRHEENKNSIEMRDIVGYNISYMCNNRNINTIIHKSDKKLMEYLKGIKHSNNTYKDVKQLWLYDSVESNSYDGLTTYLEKSEDFNKSMVERLDYIRKNSSIILRLQNGSYRSEEYGIDLKIRNTLKLNCSENRIMFNELNN